MSLKADCEQAAIELLKSEPLLAEFPPKPRDRDTSRKLPQLIVEATVGAQRKDGCKPFEVGVAVELRTNKTDTSVGLRDSFWSAVERALARGQGLTPKTARRFRYLRVEDDASGDQSSADDSRLRTRTYPLLAAPAL